MGSGGWVAAVEVVTVGEEMVEECCVEDEVSMSAVTALWRGEVRRTGEMGAGWVCTPGSAMSNERSVALAELAWVSSGVTRLCSGWRA